MARGIDGPGGYLHSGACNDMVVDGFFDVHVSVKRPFRFQVPDGGETVFQGYARAPGSTQGTVGDGLLEELLGLIIPGNVSL